MTDLPRILIGVTTYEGKDYIFDRAMKHIAALDYPRFNVVVVDNSPTLNYFAKLKRRGYRDIYHISRGANSREALTNSQNKIRGIFLEGNYDYLLMIESDLLVPRDTIKRLLSWDKPLVGSVYNIGRQGQFIPCIFLDDVKKQGFKGTRPLGVKEIDGKKTYIKSEIVEFLNRGGIQKCHGCGLGCTLIKREVIEDVGAFWCDERMTDKHSDVYFYLDCSRKNIPVYVDTTILVPHYPSAWEDVKDR